MCVCVEFFQWNILCDGIHFSSNRINFCELLLRCFTFHIQYVFALVIKMSSRLRMKKIDAHAAAADVDFDDVTFLRQKSKAH